MNTHRPRPPVSLLLAIGPGLWVPHGDKNVPRGGDIAIPCYSALELKEDAQQMPELPSGTVTFLFTACRRVHQAVGTLPASYGGIHGTPRRALAWRAMESSGGFVFKTIGDAFCVAFPSAPHALEAALAAQRALLSEAREQTGPLRTRMALHTGSAEERAGDYFGAPVNRIARLLSAGHGG